MRRSVLRAYGAVAVADVVLAGRGAKRARRVTKPLLMPLLMVHVVGAADEAADVKGLVLGGLGLSWLGDVALLGEGEGPFAAGLLSFLAAHCCYLAAFARRRRGGVRKARPVAAAYALAWAALNLVLYPRTGRMRVPVLVYGTALAAMAMAALDTDIPAVAAGGAAFLASDSILALGAFDAATVPAGDALVMLTYTAAQALIATGVVTPARAG